MGGVADALGSNWITDPLDLSGQRGQKAADSAANAQITSNRDTINFLEQLYNAQVGNNSFQQGIGNQALAQLGSLYGLTPGVNPGSSATFVDGKLTTTPGATGTAGTSGTPDYSSFFSSPDYQFALQEGNKALGANQAARGNLFSGGAARELDSYNQGMASQQFGNYYNRLAGLAGIGQTTTQNTNNALSSLGGGVSNALSNIGDANSSRYLSGYGAQQNGANNALQLGSLAAAFFSDRRLKTNIEPIGSVGPYLWYRFRYVWGQMAEGPMADEVQAINPAAVHEGPNGFLMIDPEKL